MYPTTTQSSNAFLRRRAAYLELVRAVGPEVFDDVPDRFNIRALIAQEQEISDQLNNI